MCSLLILSPAKAVNQVDLTARRKESVPFDQVSVMILTGWPVTGRNGQVVPVVGQNHQTFPLGCRRDQQVSRARGPVLASLGQRRRTSRARSQPPSCIATRPNSSHAANEDDGSSFQHRTALFLSL
jgi:hypothetical protein